MKKLIIPLLIAVLLILTVASVNSTIPGLCKDGIDNDGDGYVDREDVGCSVDYPNNEKSPWFTCDDGLDNDGDGLYDFPDDPGCTSQQDWNEIDFEEVCENNHNVKVKFNYNFYGNWGNGDFKPVVYAGGDAYNWWESIPLIEDGVNILDGEFDESNIDVEGLYLYRGEGYIYVALYGGHATDQDIEVISGYFDLEGTVVTGFINSEGWHGPVDGQGNGEYILGNVNEDEIVHENLNSKVGFHMSVDMDYDSFYIFYNLNNVIVNEELCPVEPECYEDSACGTDGFIDEPVCMFGDVYQDFREFTCNNPGLENAFCSGEVTSVLLESCTFGCFDSKCIIEPPVCEDDIDCGQPYTTKNYCVGDNVAVDHVTPVCEDDECGEETETEILEECDYGCKEGECLPEPPVECCEDGDCGEDGFIGDSYCVGGVDVYNDFISFTCNLAGTPSNFCEHFIEQMFMENCELGCEDGTCNEEPPVCEEDSDCGDEYYSDDYCEDDSVYRDLVEPLCVGESCEVEVTPELVDECDSDEYCSNGECKEKRDDDNRGSITWLGDAFGMCTPDWDCGGWSECYEDMRFRTCTDLNYCDLEMNKPVDRTGCEEVLPVVLGDESSSFNLGLFLLIIGIVLIVILIIVMVIIKGA